MTTSAMTQLLKKAVSAEPRLRTEDPQPEVQCVVNVEKRDLTGAQINTSAESAQGEDKSESDINCSVYLEFQLNIKLVREDNKTVEVPLTFGDSFLVPHSM